VKILFLHHQQNVLTYQLSNRFQFLENEKQQNVLFSLKLFLNQIPFLCGLELLAAPGSFLIGLSKTGFS
jgi:hypothetical protein